ncbi:magnesium chelatase subunit ChlI family protein [Candidatus Liberibacter brunswickensis]|uniref:magnesium chelatase subunit ChlI family protein n=1 Tax=Candidatus Liberibacter brunswickensis TaxID=1968796 RepID=UPI002FE18EFE
MDIRIAVPAVPVSDLFTVNKSESSEDIAAHVLLARKKQKNRLEKMGSSLENNADCSSVLIEKIAYLNKESSLILNQYAEKMTFSARGYHKILKIARTIADLDSSEEIQKPHIAEAIAYRQSNQFSISNR